MAGVEKLITEHIDVWTSAIKKRNATGRGSNKKIELTGIKKLRELILELAVRGKLVPQDPSDEPASVLLEKIAEEKAQLIADKKIKKQKPLSAITDEEKPFELPGGWGLTRLDDICVGITSGSTPPKDKFDEKKGVPYLKVYNIKDQKIAFDYRPQFVDNQHHKEKLTRSILYPNDVVMNIVGPPLGKIAIIPDDYPEWNCNQAIVFFRPIESRLSGYIYTFLTAGQFLDAIELIGTAGQDNISVTKSRSILFPIPPLAEQHRIVAKVDELMALCDQLEQQTEQSLSAHQTLVEVLLASLSSDTLTDGDNKEDFQISWQRIAEYFDVLFTTEASIEQLKQTILQLAVMGELVPQNPNDEPASVLLEKIAEEKAQLIADKKIKKQKPLPVITDDEKPFRVPSSWEWCNLGILTTIRGGKRLPKGQQLTTEKTPYIYIRVTDMRNGSVREDDLHYISEEIQSQISNYIITKNDIYMTIVGATIGKCGLVPAKFDGMNLTENAARITPFCGIDKTYLFKCLASSFAQKQFFDKTNQVGVQKMALIRLSGTKIPFPPLAEQHRIVAKVDELMALCDQLKARLVDAQSIQLHLADAVVENALT
jgi:type I restriction enzyme S subunit